VPPRSPAGIAAGCTCKLLCSFLFPHRRGLGFGDPNRRHNEGRAALSPPAHNARSACAPASVPGLLLAQGSVFRLGRAGTGNAGRRRPPARDPVSAAAPAAQLRGAEIGVPRPPATRSQTLGNPFSDVWRRARPSGTAVAGEDLPGSWLPTARAPHCVAQALNLHLRGGGPAPSPDATASAIWVLPVASAADSLPLGVGRQITGPCAQDPTPRAPWARRMLMQCRSRS